MHKTLNQIMLRPPAHWVGDGFNVYPVFANKAFTNDISPFLMFDYGAPKKFPATKKRLGVGQHPHRGFETVTIAFQGEVEHADNKGNRGVIGPGDVQWMTAGRGIIHEEFHSTEFAKTGGIFEMCQLWVNLPASHKMTKPRYQAILSSSIKTAPLSSKECIEVTESDGTVRIIAGKYQGIEGPALTHTPMDMLDVLINCTSRSFDFEFPESYNVIVFARSGEFECDGKRLGPQDIAIMNRGGSVLNIKATTAGSKLLILAGEPLNEPIVQHGPMCMNTKAEINKAISDFQNGKF